MEPTNYGLTRTSFQLDPALDCGIFAGREDVRDRLEARIRRGLATNTSVHTFIYGDYGSGKTHTLHYFHKYVSEQHDTDILPIFVQTPQIDAKSTPSHLFRSIVSSISPVEIFNLFSIIYDAHQNEMQSYPDLYTKVSLLNNYVKNRDLSNIIYKYILSRPSIDYSVLKWLSGEKCTAKEKQNLNVILDNSDPNVAIRTLLTLFKLFNQYNKKYVLLLLDELETLRVLSPKKMVDFETFFRQLVSEQHGLAIVMAQSVQQSLEEGVPIFLGGSPVGTRIGYPQNYIYLQPFDTSESLLGFVKDLIAQLRPPNIDIGKLIKAVKSETDETMNEELYPFSEEALDLLAQRIIDAGRELYPRDIQNAATQCLGEVISNDKKIINSEIVSIVMTI